MKFACAYSIVQFRPYMETGEFANVGVVLLCAEGRFVDFQLIKKYARVTQFFKELDRAVYLRSMELFREEMTRFCSFVRREALDGRKRTPDIAVAEAAFAELARPREGILRFSEPRLAMAATPEDKLGELFDHYVGRNFATPEYQERLLESQVGRTLKRGGKLFIPAKVGDDYMHVRFPFVRQAEQQATAIIKPLYLGQSESSKIFTKGGSWVDRITRLKKRNLLPQDVLFALAGPTANEGKCFDAFQEIAGELKNKGVQVIAANDEQQILKFVEETA